MPLVPTTNSIWFSPCFFYPRPLRLCSHWASDFLQLPGSLVRLWWSPPLLFETGELYLCFGLDLDHGPRERTWWANPWRSVQFSSVTQSCLTLCDPMNCSTPGLPVHHQLPEFTQTHVHRVGDAIQPSHPLSSPSPPAPNPSQHQSLFQWVNSSHEVAKVLEFQL